MLQLFVAHYAKRWPDAAVSERERDGFKQLVISSPSLLRDGSLPDESLPDSQSQQDYGNCPQILHSGEVTDNVIVLIHGLTDSPAYMRAIAEDFVRIGFNVVLPLLPAHGLRRPGRAFHHLQHTEWIEAIGQVCDIAQQLGRKLSIGGLSTGGALATHKVVSDPESITGALFLYSAALDIGTVEQLVLQTEAGRMIARLRDHQLWLAKTVKDQLQMILDDQAEGRSNEFFGIGKNPYKYSVLFYEGASQLAEVIQAINQHYESRHLKFNDLHQPTFVVHAKDDDSARYRGVELLVENHPNDAIALLTLEGVPHASVVLREPLVDDPEHEEYAPANEFYDQMSAKMLAFAQRYLI